MKKKSFSKIVILCLIPVIVLIVGFTLAYFIRGIDYSKGAKVTYYSTSLEKSCDVPDNWAPGDSFNCEVYGKSDSDIPVALRVVIKPYWVYPDLENIPSNYSPYLGNWVSEQEFDIEDESNSVAIFNFINYDDWTIDPNYDWGYYDQSFYSFDDIPEIAFYYNYKLTKGDSTSSLIDSITFNDSYFGISCDSNWNSSPSYDPGYDPDPGGMNICPECYVVPDDNVEVINTENGKKYSISAIKYFDWVIDLPDDPYDPVIVDDVPSDIINCSSGVTNNYSNYNFNFIYKVETVQYDAYQEVWNTDVVIE